MARLAASFALAAALLAACAIGGASANDSTGWMVSGFEVVSNVTGYLYMSRDACDIRALATAAPPLNLTAINSIYRNGLNSIRPDGRLRRNLASWTMGSHALGHPYYTNGTALYNDTNWMASFINAALDPTVQLTEAQRAWMIIHTTRLQLPLSYMLTELNSIVDAIDPNGTNITQTGAPHVLDEGFGAYHGNASDCAPWAYAEEAAYAFGTLNAACTRSRVNDNIIAAFNQIQAATLNGNVSQAEEGITEALRNTRVSLVQNVLLRAKRLQDAWRAWTSTSQDAQDANDAFLQMPDNAHAAAAVAAVSALVNATVRFDAAKADAYSLARALGPFVHQVHPYAAHALNHYYSLDTPVTTNFYSAVRYALQDLYPAMGITADMVGTLGASSVCPSGSARLARRLARA